MYDPNHSKESKIIALMKIGSPKDKETKKKRPSNDVSFVEIVFRLFFP
jgi:hypothetical protein